MPSAADPAPRGRQRFAVVDDLASLAAPQRDRCEIFLKPASRQSVIEALPRLFAQAGKVAAADPSDRPGEKGSGLFVVTSTGVDVLVVDDNEINRTVIGAMLTTLGLSSTSLPDGRFVTEVVERVLPSLALLDVSLPEVDGLEATRRLRTHSRHATDFRIPVIALTAHASDRDRERCLQAGMDDFMTKAVTVDVLSDMLAKWLGAASGVVVSRLWWELAGGAISG